MTTIGIGDSGHVHGLSIVVTGAIGDMRIAADRAGKEWLLAPLYSIPGQGAGGGRPRKDAPARARRKGPRPPEGERGPSYAARC